MKFVTKSCCLMLAIICGLTVTSLQAQESETKVTLEQVPANVQLAIQKAVGDGKLIDIGEMKANGKLTFEIEMHRDGKEIDVLFDTQGEELKRTIEGDVAAQKPSPKESTGEDENKNEDKEDEDADEDEEDHEDADDEIAEGFQHAFDLGHRQLATKGRNRFFILEPGYQLVLAGKDGAHDAKLEITVMQETRDVSGIPTRVVEERETVDGKLGEISRNFFAICKNTGSVFYFGEEVDIYRDGQVVNHEGAWLHGKYGAQAGIMMPGECLPGAAYYQEYAPRQAMDRARIKTLDASIKTPAGEFSDCLTVWEENPLDGDSETKTFAPGIGLVQDEDLLLVKYGFVTP